MDITATQIMNGLGFAVLHSLWQGILAAIVVVIIRSFTKGSQASLRCALETVILAACFLAFVFTFIINTGASAPASLSIATIIESAGSILPVAMTGPVESESSTLVLQNPAYYAPILGMLWCLGFMLLSVKYSMALYMTHKLRKRGLSDAPSEWARRFKVLVLNSGIFRGVALHVSSKVSGPVTMGFFRPVVLVPAGFFTGLPPDQVEAILMHEIAHIRRHDYLINLVQTAIKTILFYHPGIHFICKCIDEDREQACDDFAVRYTQNPTSLIKGLAALRLNPAIGNFALAASETRNPLLRRLTRLNAPEESRRRPEQVVTSLAALMVAAGFYIGLKPVTADASASNAAHDVVHVSSEKQNYHFATTRHNGRDITYKQAADGSRWVNVRNSWFNIDSNPNILDAVPAIPVAPRMPSPDNFNSYVKFEKAANQYRVNLDYYIASIQNMSGDSTQAEKLRLASKQKRRVSLPNPDFDVDYLQKTAASSAPEIPETPGLIPGLYLEGELVTPETHESWTPTDSEKIEKLTKKFEQKMEAIEEGFEDALDRFEDASEDYAENPKANLKSFEKAQREFAEAVANANLERDSLSEDLDRNISKIVNSHVKKIEQDWNSNTDSTTYHAAEKTRIKTEKNTQSDLAQKEVSDGYKNGMLAQLKSDALIDQNAETADVLFKDGLVFVDGKKIPHSKEDNYCKINKAFNIQKSDYMRVEISPQRLTITNHAH